MKSIKKILMYIFLILTCTYVINAIGTAPDTNNTLAYYTFDGNTLDSTPNGNDATNNGAVLTTGIINQAYDFNGTTDYMYLPNGTLQDYTLDDHTISMWANFDDVSSSQMLFTTDDNNQGATFNIEGANTITFQVFDGVSRKKAIYSNINTTDWFHLVGVYKRNSQVELYVNGVSIQNTSVGTVSYFTNKQLAIGKRSNQNSQYFNGIIDEPSFYNYSLTQDEINYLYQNGNPGAAQQYPFSFQEPTLTFTNVSVNNQTLITNTYFNTSNLDWYVEVINSSTNDDVNLSYNWISNITILNPTLTFSNVTRPVSILNSGNLAYCGEIGGTLISSSTGSVGNAWVYQGVYPSGSWSYPGFSSATLASVTCQVNQSNQFATNSLNGTFNLNLFDGQYNIDLLAINNQTNSTVNYDFFIDTNPAVVTFNNNTEINNFEFNISNELNVTCTDDNLDYCFISWDDATITNSTTGLFPVNKSFSNSGNHTFNITAIDLAGNINTVNGLTLINPLAFFYIVDNATNPITNFTLGGRSDVNGAVNYSYYNDGLVIGNNSLLFEKFGYVSQTINFALNTSAPAFNQTYNVSEARITVTIRDRETQNIVTGVLFKLEFIASVGLVTNTTTGVKEITNVLFQDENYQLVVSSDTYTTEQLFFDFSNKEEIDLTIYTTFINDTKRGIVEVKVVDKFGKSIVGAIAQALQWDSATSSYIKVSEGLTAENGKTLLNIILDTEQYIFQAKFGNIAKNTSPQFIPELLNGKEIIISLDEGATEFEGFLENVAYTITESFDNQTSVSNITLNWMTQDNTDVTGCIRYYRIQPTGSNTLISEDCSTSSTGILSVSKNLNSSYYIQARVGFDIQGVFYVQETFDYPPSNDISKVLQDTNLAIFILPLLFLVTVLLGMLNIFIGAITLLIISGLSLYLMPQYLSTQVVAFIYFVGLLIMVGGAKRR